VVEEGKKGEMKKEMQLQEEQKGEANRDLRIGQEASGGKEIE